MILIEQLADLYTSLIDKYKFNLGNRYSPQPFDIPDKLATFCLKVYVTDDNIATSPFL